MFDFNLTDVSATLCVGVISILLIGYLYYISRKFFSPDFDSDGFITEIKKELDKERKNSGYLLIGVIWIYCVGFFVGDLTSRMTDSDTTYTGFFLKVLRTVNQMKKQDETRTEAFFYEEKTTDTSKAGCSDKKELRLTALGRSALNTPKVVDNANLLAGTKICVDPLRPSDENWKEIATNLRYDKNYESDFKSFIHQIYYTGKNWCYAKEGEPLNELKAIQNRIDMARSTVLLMDFGILSLFLIVVYKQMYIRRCKASGDPYDYDFGKLGKYHKAFYISQLHVFCILLLIVFFSRQCFEIDQSNYTRRACGYYIGDINRAEHLQINEDNPKTTVSTENVKH